MGEIIEALPLPDIQTSDATTEGKGRNDASCAGAGQHQCLQCLTDKVADGGLKSCHCDSRWRTWRLGMTGVGHD